MITLFRRLLPFLGMLGLVFLGFVLGVLVTLGLVRHTVERIQTTPTAELAQQLTDRVLAGEKLSDDQTTAAQTIVQKGLDDFRALRSQFYKETRQLILERQEALFEVLPPEVHPCVQERLEKLRNRLPQIHADVDAFSDKPTNMQ
ncbi:MAG: hypothetical protein ACFCU3_07290 [Verrucomicrobiales bacterium]